MSPVWPDVREWLEADGRGGFASGTTSGVRTRRYHALLLPATDPPGGRRVQVNGFEAWLESESGRVALTTQHYGPDVLHPDGAQRIARFDALPWPRWTYRLEDGLEVVHEVFVARNPVCTVLSWRLRAPRRAARLAVRLLLSGRDYHTLHHENGAFRFDADVRGSAVCWRPYADLPAVVARTNGAYEHAPLWYRNFLYAEERARGLDASEDLASPGVLHWNLTDEAVLVLSTGGEAVDAERIGATDAPSELVRRLRHDEERRRSAMPTTLARAADSYVVRRGSGRTIIAGYPWFTDWGRDTFVAMRGLFLATGRFDVARDILLEWSSHVSDGMLPNRFPDGGSEPEFNSVDASLWYVIAVGDYLGGPGARALSSSDRSRLVSAIEAILSGYAAGTRHGIRADADGLLSAGEPGVQLTWMDAKVGDWVVTPRIGKPVEVQALWLNALRIGATESPRWEPVYVRGRRSFGERFWNPARCFLYDVVDVDHVPGAVDPSLRPNQIFAIGGLPVPLLEGARARAVVDAVEADLWTPLGLRSLAPTEASYVGRYEGGVRERDGAYHQGTAWPWLLGAFVDAWLRVRRGAGVAARLEARARFLEPLHGHLAAAGLGHVSEIADGDRPHTPRGCPFQAWSVGELIRVEQMLRVPVPLADTG